MSTTGYIRDICINCISSLILFGFKYFWKMFKLMRSKPWVISQIKSMVMMILPVILILRYPGYILFTIYCLAAMLYGVYSTYKNSVEYERDYYIYKRAAREKEIDEAWRTDKAEQAKERDNQKETIKGFKDPGYHPFENVSSAEQAKKIYHKLLKMGHPDNGGDEEFTKYITEQYEEACRRLGA